MSRASRARSLAMPFGRLLASMSDAIWPFFAPRWDSEFRNGLLGGERVPLSRTDVITFSPVSLVLFGERDM